jgi:hypothetical protein
LIFSSSHWKPTLQIGGLSEAVGSSHDRRVPEILRAPQLQRQQGADPYIVLILRHLCWHGMRDAVMSVVVPVTQTALDLRQLGDDDTMRREFGPHPCIRLADLVLNEREIAHMTSVDGVLPDIHAGDLGSCRNWIESHAVALSGAGVDMKPTLEFNLLALRFLEIFESLSMKEALDFASSHFAPYLGRFSTRIGELMTRLVVSSGTSFSSSKTSSSSEVERHYGLLTAIRERRLLCYNICRASAILHGLPVEGSALDVLLDVGSLCVESELFSRDPVDLFAPEELFSEKTDGPKSSSESSGETEIPVEVRVPDVYRFHTVFSCPVTWERASPINRPVLLQCSHAILEESLSLLPKRSGKTKCPTCYHEVNPSEVLPMTI